MAKYDYTVRGKLELDARNASKTIKKLEKQGFNLGGIDAKGTRKFTQPLGKIRGELGEFEKSMAASNARVIAFGASTSLILGISNAFKATAKSAIEVEKSLSDINVILNASSNSLKAFGNELFEIAKNTGQSFQAVAEAAGELARQGLGIEATLQRTSDALILARLSGMDTVDAVNSLTAAVNSFSKSALTSTEIVNKLANVDAAFAVSSADLAEAIKRVGSSAADAGVSMDQLIAIVTTAQQTTARGGAVIGNSFKTIFTRLQRPAVLEQLESLGVATKNAAGGMNPLITTLKSLATTFDTLEDSQKASVAELVGGVFQVNVLKAALSDIGKEYGTFARAVDISINSTDEAIRRNAALNETLDALINRTFVNLQKVGAGLGEVGFAPQAKGMLNVLNDSLGLDDFGKGAEGAGEKIAKGLAKGIGNFLSGPGLLLATVGIGALLHKLSKFSVDAAKGLLGLNKSSEIRTNLEQRTLEILKSEEGLLDDVLNDKKSIKRVAQDILFIHERDEKALRAAAKIMKSLSGMSLAGVRQGPMPVGLFETVTQQGAVTRSGSRKGKAHGFIPNLAKNEAEERLAMMAAGYRPSDVRNAGVRSTRIHDGTGGSFSSLVNSKETVRTGTNAKGYKATFVVPPKSSQAFGNYMGSLPNFAGPKIGGDTVVRTPFTPQAWAALLAKYPDLKLPAPNEKGKIAQKPWKQFWESIMLKQIPAGQVFSGTVMPKATPLNYGKKFGGPSKESFLRHVLGEGPIETPPVAARKETGPKLRRNIKNMTAGQLLKMAGLAGPLAVIRGAGTEDLPKDWGVGLTQAFGVGLDKGVFDKQFDSLYPHMTKAIGKKSFAQAIGTHPKAHGTLEKNIDKIAKGDSQTRGRLFETLVASLAEDPKKAFSGTAAIDISKGTVWHPDFIEAGLIPKGLATRTKESGAEVKLGEMRLGLMTEAKQYKGETGTAFQFRMGGGGKGKFAAPLIGSKDSKNKVVAQYVGKLLSGKGELMNKTFGNVLRDPKLLAAITPEGSTTAKTAKDLREALSHFTHLELQKPGGSARLGRREDKMSASGFIPSFSAALAKRTERGMGGSPEMRLWPFPHVADKNKQKNFADVMRDHPEGLSKAISNSAAMQDLFKRGGRAGGFLPNMASPIDKLFGAVGGRGSGYERVGTKKLRKHTEGAAKALDNLIDQLAQLDTSSDKTREAISKQGKKMEEARSKDSKFHDQRFNKATSEFTLKKSMEKEFNQLNKDRLRLGKKVNSMEKRKISIEKEIDAKKTGIAGQTKELSGRLTRSDKMRSQAFTASFLTPQIAGIASQFAGPGAIGESVEGTGNALSMATTALTLIPGPAGLVAAGFLGLGGLASSVSDAFTKVGRRLEKTAEIAKANMQKMQDAGAKYIEVAGGFEDAMLKGAPGQILDRMHRKLMDSLSSMDVQLQNSLMSADNIEEAQERFAAALNKKAGEVKQLEIAKALADALNKESGGFMGVMRGLGGVFSGGDYTSGKHDVNVLTSDNIKAFVNDFFLSVGKDTKERLRAFRELETAKTPIDLGQKAQALDTPVRLELQKAINRFSGEDFINFMINIRKHLDNMERQIKQSEEWVKVQKEFGTMLTHIKKLQQEHNDALLDHQRVLFRVIAANRQFRAQGALNLIDTNIAKFDEVFKVLSTNLSRIQKMDIDFSRKRLGVERKTHEALFRLTNKFFGTDLLGSMGKVTRIVPGQTKIEQTSRRSMRQVEFSEKLLKTVEKFAVDNDVIAMQKAFSAALGSDDSIQDFSKIQRKIDDNTGAFLVAANQMLQKQDQEIAIAKAQLDIQKKLEVLQVGGGIGALKDPSKFEESLSKVRELRASFEQATGPTLIGSRGMRAGEMGPEKSFGMRGIGYKISGPNSIEAGSAAVNLMEILKQNNIPLGKGALRDAGISGRAAQLTKFGAELEKFGPLSPEAAAAGKQIRENALKIATKQVDALDPAGAMSENIKELRASLEAFGMEYGTTLEGIRQTIAAGIKDEKDVFGLLRQSSKELKAASEQLNLYSGRQRAHETEGSLFRTIDTRAIRQQLEGAKRAEGEAIKEFSASVTTQSFLDAVGVKQAGAFLGIGGGGKQAGKFHYGRDVARVGAVEAWSAFDALARNATMGLMMSSNEKGLSEVAGQIFSEPAAIKAMFGAMKTWRLTGAQLGPEGVEGSRGIDVQNKIDIMALKMTKAIVDAQGSAGKGTRFGLAVEKNEAMIRWVIAQELFGARKDRNLIQTAAMDKSAGGRGVFDALKKVSDSFRDQRLLPQDIERREGVQRKAVAARLGASFTPEAQNVAIEVLNRTAKTLENFTAIQANMNPLIDVLMKGLRIKVDDQTIIIDTTDAMGKTIQESVGRATFDAVKAALKDANLVTTPQLNKLANKVPGGQAAVGSVPPVSKGGAP